MICTALGAYFYGILSVGIGKVYSRAVSGKREHGFKNNGSLILYGKVLIYCNIALTLIGKNVCRNIILVNGTGIAVFIEPA